MKHNNLLGAIPQVILVEELKVLIHIRNWSPPWGPPEVNNVVLGKSGSHVI